MLTYLKYLFFKNGGGNFFSRRCSALNNCYIFHGRDKRQKMLSLNYKGLTLFPPIKIQMFYNCFIIQDCRYSSNVWFKINVNIVGQTNDNSFLLLLCLLNTWTLNLSLLYNSNFPSWRRKRRKRKILVRHRSVITKRVTLKLKMKNNVRIRRFKETTWLILPPSPLEFLSKWVIKRY